MMVNTIIKNVKRGHMSAILLTLLEANNTVTTLEVKNELRSKFPDFSWLQGDVSKFMNDMHLAGDLTYEDNGTYRTYSGEAKKKSYTKKNPKTGKNLKKVSATRISKSKAMDLMLGNKGYFFTAEFVKKDGEVRVMNCQCVKGQDPKLGYVKVREASLMRTDPDKSFRQINIQTIGQITNFGSDHPGFLFNLSIPGYLPFCLGYFPIYLCVS